MRRNRSGLAMAIIAGGAVGPALLMAGLVHTPAATASLLLNLELVFTVLLAATLFREHLGRTMVTAAVWSQLPACCWCGSRVPVRP